MSEYDTQYEPLITCPYCGHEDINSSEWAGQFDGDERAIECGTCERSFKMTTHIELTFSTEKIDT